MLKVRLVTSTTTVNLSTPLADAKTDLSKAEATVESLVAAAKKAV